MNKNADVSIKGKTKLALLAFVTGFTINLTGFVTAIFAHSLIAITDTINGMVESLSMLLAFLALKGVQKNNKEAYNYGRGKLENMASIGIAFALLLSFFMITKDVIQRLKHPEELHLTAAIVYIVISLCSTFINYFLWKKAHYIHEKAPSSSINSQEHVFFEKIITSTAVVISLIISVVLEKNDFKWGAYIDPLVSLGLAFMILYSAYNIIRKSMYELLDGTLEESLQIIIMKVLTHNFNEYKDLHGIRSHRAGTTVYIELFLEFEANLLMEEVYLKIDKIKKDIESTIKDSEVLIVPSTTSRL